jgi:hypothetical protein
MCSVVALAVFTKYNYAFIWSFTATLSYAAYQHQPAKENLLLIGIGYVLLFGFAIWEIKRKQSKQQFV